MVNSIITLKNVERFSTKLSEHQLKWMFEDTQGNGITSNIESQIIPLQREAAQFLLDFRNTQKHLNNELFKDSNFLKEEDTFISKQQSNESIKRWLFERNIPLDRKVFWVNQLNVAFILTWKMVIKFSDILFFGTDEILWDKTMNWVLSFESDEVFYFVDNLMYDPESRRKEMKEMDKIINTALRLKELEEMEEVFYEAISVQDAEVMSKASKAKQERVKLVRQQMGL